MTRMTQKRLGKFQGHINDFLTLFKDHNLLTTDIARHQIDLLFDAAPNRSKII